MDKNSLDISVTLKGEDLQRFQELKNFVGVGRPNAALLKQCLKETHKLFLG